MNGPGLFLLRGQHPNPSRLPNTGVRSSIGRMSKLHFDSTDFIIPMNAPKNMRLPAHVTLFTHRSR